MVEATSQYLNTRMRPLSEVERERAMQGGCNGDSITDACDMLRMFSEQLTALRDRMIAYDGRLLGDYIAQLSDAADDMMSQRQRIQENEDAFR